jgi:hypothetical protein
MARALRALLWAVVAGAVLCGAAMAADPAAGLPADMVVYGELTHEAAQRVLGAISMPPVAGLVPALNAGRFSHLDQALSLPPGTVEQAARHLDRAAFGYGPPDKVMGVISFSDGFSAASLLPPGAPTPLPLGPDAAVGARGSMLCIAAPALCSKFLVGGYPALADQTAFKAARERLKDADAWFYADIPAILRSAKETASPPAGRDMQEAMEFFGLSNAESLTARLDVNAPSANAVLRLGQGEKGFFGLLPSGPLDLVSMVPQKPSAALLLEWKDAPAFFGGLMDLTKAIDTTYNDLSDEQEMADFEMRTGIKLKDISKTLGSGLAVYLPVPAQDGMLHPDQAVAVLSLKDPGTFRANLAHILGTLTGAPMLPQTFGNHPGLKLTVAPLVIAFLNDRAVIAMDRPAVEGYIKWMSSGGPAMAEKAPDACGLLYLDAGLLLHSYPQPAPGAQVWLTLARHDRDVQFSASLENANPSLARIYVGMTAMMAAMTIPAMERAMTEAQAFKSQNQAATLEQRAPRLSDSQLAQMVKTIPRDQWGSLPPEVQSQLEAYSKAHGGS